VITKLTANCQGEQTHFTAENKEIAKDFYYIGRLSTLSASAAVRHPFVPVAQRVT